MTLLHRVLAFPLFVLLALLSSAQCGIAETRVALVIGNSHYVNTPALSNPSNDATDVAAALTDVGFKVTLGVDMTKRQFDGALAQFARDAKKADAALFYFAGHGMQFQGSSYVMPVDAELEDEVSLRYEMVAIEEIKTALLGSNGVKILVLDSCRDNPLASKLVRSISLTTRDVPRVQGLAHADRTAGMIIVYATQADALASDGSGRNSPFSSAFLKELREPGLEVGTLFRRVEDDVFQSTHGEQSPELSISMVPEYFLNQAETDQMVWARIRNNSNVSALREFIARYPKSFYVPDAYARVDLLEQQARQSASSGGVISGPASNPEDAAQLQRKIAERDQAAAAARVREQELNARLADLEATRTKLSEELAQRPVSVSPVPSTEKGDIGKSPQARVEALTAEISDLGAQATIAKAQADQTVSAKDRQTPGDSVARLETPSPEAAKLPEVRNELRRLGCFTGPDVGWDAQSLKLGVAKYVRYANLAAAPVGPDPAFLEDMKKRRAGLCPPECAIGEIVVGDKCVARNCKPGEVMSRSGECLRRPPVVHASSAAGPKPATPGRAAGNGKHCFNFNGSEYCE